MKRERGRKKHLENDGERRDTGGNGEGRREDSERETVRKEGREKT